MFDVSLTELMVIGVVALIVIGPERLPKVARTVGHLLGRAQRYVNDVKSDIQREIELDELRKFKNEMEDAAQGVKQSLNDTHAALQEPVQQFRAELDEVAREASGKPAAAAGTDAAAAPAEPLMQPLAGQPATTPSANVTATADAPAAGSPAAGSPAAGSPAAPDAPRTIAPPSPNLSLDLDTPAPVPATQPAPAPSAPAAGSPAAAAPAATSSAAGDTPPAKPATPSGTTT
ncbi:Sec-independent protein translocase protein TatB [Achromobacter deleyi]|uniref:Sec-independent protein translocase protein TatB n=2 Tax=Achromobacter deleyi TaxID=1353891 RepID=A0A6S7BGS3_9BURK|nr:Sec-independent protein translocase protein TatB [Achromobacter deleyi]CAB3730784.1 Sec-independent protein translocase protein TatB [Achromobacter deleyi]CAB3886278.1 Sec-independent protein translocase protein TatB [Achromobacter deleyi]CAB3887484.1 Sec-independent protein translocase protein TatB [Achromobacter deleyi]